MLSDMQEQHAQASQAQISSLNDIAEAIRDSNKTLTRVVEKMSTDSQQSINRREASTSEQQRHADAAKQFDSTQNSNKLLGEIKEALVGLTNSINALLATPNGTAANFRTIPRMP